MPEPEEKEHVCAFPKRKMSKAETAYGLWIGMAYSTITPQIDYFDQMRHRSFDFYSISHLYDGGGKVQFGSDPVRLLSPGDCVIVTPHVSNRYASYGPYLYLEDSVKFAGPVADMLFDAGILRSGVCKLGRARRLLPVIKLFNSFSVKSRLKANILLQNILMDIFLDERESPTDEAPRLDELLAMINKSLEQWWTLDEMADICQVSRTHLRRLFLQITGMPPKTYVDTQKINRACSLLITSDIPVAEIAARLGWEDPYHFSRRFKLITGLAPAVYRNQVLPEK